MGRTPIPPGLKILQGRGNGRDSGGRPDAYRAAGPRAWSGIRGMAAAGGRGDVGGPRAPGGRS